MKEYWEDIKSKAKLFKISAKFLKKEVMKYVENIDPSFVLSKTNNYPTEDEINERINETNPWGADRLTDKQRKRYAARIAMEKDIMDAVKTDEKKITTYRLYDPDKSCFLVTMDVYPDCSDDLNDKIIDYGLPEQAAKGRQSYEATMRILGLEPNIQVVGLNSDGKIIEVL